MISCKLDSIGGIDGKGEPFFLTMVEMEYVENNNSFAIEPLNMYYENDGMPYGNVLSTISLQMFLGM